MDKGRMIVQKMELEDFENSRKLTPLFCFFNSQTDNIWKVIIYKELKKRDDLIEEMGKKLEFNDILSPDDFDCNGNKKYFEYDEIWD